VVEEKRQMFSHLSTAALRSDEIKTASSIDDQLNIDENSIINHDHHTDHDTHHHHHEQIEHNKLQIIHTQTKEVGVNTDDENTVEDNYSMIRNNPSKSIPMNSSSFGMSSSRTGNTKIDVNTTVYHGSSSSECNVEDGKLSDDNSHINISSHTLDAMRRLLLSSKLMPPTGESDTLMMMMMGSEDHVTLSTGIDSIFKLTAARLQEEMLQLDGDIGR